MKNFLEHYISPEPGAVLTKNGDSIGTHNGAAYYTLGQRHGFSLSSQKPNTGRHYVVKKDMQANTITVVEHAPGITESSVHLTLQDTSWISTPPGIRRQYHARIRHRGSLTPVTITAMDNDRRTANVVLEVPSLCSPGQSLVLYEGAACLGGGVIQDTADLLIVNDKS